jgi:hypothetical protein
MTGKKKIQMYIKLETYERLRSVRRIPSREWHKHVVPENWGIF